MVIILFIIQLVIYFTTVTNTIYGGDAGDLVSAIIDKGIPHPPGYPLFTLLGIVANKIPIHFLSPAGKVTLISILAHFLSSIAIYLLIKEFFSVKKTLWLTLLTVIIISFNYVIWLYSVVPEVFALNSLIVLYLYYFSLKFYKEQNKKYLYYICLLIGLGLSHHHTFLLMLPSLFYLLYGKLTKIKFSLKFVFFLFLGLLPYLYIPIAFHSNSQISWTEPTFKGFIELITRKIYGTFVAGTFISNSLLHRLIQIVNLFIFLLNDFKIPGLIFIGLGFYSLYKSDYIDKKIKISLILSLFLFGPFFVFYANFPLSGDFAFATVERFFIIFYFLLAPIIFLGIREFINMLNVIFKKLIRSRPLLKFAQVCFLITISLYPLGMLYKNYQAINTLHSDYAAENLGYDILNNVKTPSIILLSGDSTTFNTQYAYRLCTICQKDKIVIPISFFYHQYYREVLKKKYPQLDFGKENKDSLVDFIKKNSVKYYIYSNSSYKPINVSEFQWIPKGLLFLLDKNKSTINENIKEINSFWKNSLNKKLVLTVANSKKFNNLFLDDVLRIYSTAHQNTAYYLIQNSQLDLAYQHIDESLKLYPEDLDSYYLLSLFYGKKKQCGQAKSSINKALIKNKDQLYLDQLKNVCDNCYSNKTDKANCFKNFNKYKSDQKTSLNAF